MDISYEKNFYKFDFLGDKKEKRFFEKYIDFSFQILELSEKESEKVSKKISEQIRKMISYFKKNKFLIKDGECFLVKKDYLDILVMNTESFLLILNEKEENLSFQIKENYSFLFDFSKSLNLFLKDVFTSYNKNVSATDSTKFN